MNPFIPIVFLFPLVSPISQLLIFCIFPGNVEAKASSSIFLLASYPKLCSNVFFMDTVEISIKLLKLKLLFVQ